MGSAALACWTAGEAAEYSSLLIHIHTSCLFYSSRPWTSVGLRKCMSLTEHQGWIKLGLLHIYNADLLVSLWPHSVHIMWPFTNGLFRRSQVASWDQSKTTFTFLAFTFITTDVSGRSFTGKEGRSAYSLQFQESLVLLFSVFICKTGWFSPKSPSRD